jgi:predicted protein tyrosine phosphatase
MDKPPADPMVKHTVAVVCRASEWRAFRVAVIQADTTAVDVLSAAVASYANQPTKKERR